MDWSNPMAVFGFADEPQTDDGQVDDETDDIYDHQQPREDAAHPGVCFRLRSHLNGLTLEPSRRHRILRTLDNLSTSTLLSQSRKKNGKSTRRKPRCCEPSCLHSAKTLPPKRHLDRAHRYRCNHSPSLPHLPPCHLQNAHHNLKQITQ